MDDEYIEYTALWSIYIQIRFFCIKCRKNGKSFRVFEFFMGFYGIKKVILWEFVLDENKKCQLIGIKIRLYIYV